MPNLPAVSGKAAIAAFERCGFEVVRVCGSHHIMKKQGHPYVLSVPVHGNQNLASGTLRALIRGAGISVEEFGRILG